MGFLFKLSDFYFYFYFLIFLLTHTVRHKKAKKIKN